MTGWVELAEERSIQYLVGPQETLTEKPETFCLQLSFFGLLIDADQNCLSLAFRQLHSVKMSLASLAE